MIATIQLLLNLHILENKQSTQCIEKYPFVGDTPALCFQIGCFRGKKQKKSSDLFSCNSESFKYQEARTMLKGLLDMRFYVVKVFSYLSFFRFCIQNTVCQSR